MIFTITIGADQVPARLPFMPTRYRLLAAHNDARGLQLDPATGDWCKDEAGNTVECPDHDEAGTLYAASLGACWRGDDLGTSLRAHDMDLLAFGDAVTTELLQRGYDLPDILTAGREAFTRVVESIPTPKGVEAAADPLAAPVETSTTPTSAQG